MNSPSPPPPCHVHMVYWFMNAPLCYKIGHLANPLSLNCPVYTWFMNDQYTMKSVLQPRTLFIFWFQTLYCSNVRTWIELFRKNIGLLLNPILYRKFTCCSDDSFPMADILSILKVNKVIFYISILNNSQKKNPF